MSVRGVRGATTCRSNTKEDITIATQELVENIFTRNSFEIDDVCSIIFSVTSDLDAIFPGWVARVVMGLTTVPIQDVQQMKVTTDLPMCVRILIHVNTNMFQSEINHVYLNEAKQLRPDLTNKD
ncbi:MAG: chorismate mutase [Francisellaceae bacterium]|jgi:chorismate mutase